MELLVNDVVVEPSMQLEAEDEVSLRPESPFDGG
jgi:hypothetical protein